MLQRLAKHNLDTHLKIIPADDDTDEFRAFIKGVEDRFDSRQVRVAGSLLCHLKAYKYFLEESKCSECLIMEDDAMLHNDFRNKLNDMVTRRGETVFSWPRTPLISLPGINKYIQVCTITILAEFSEPLATGLTRILLVGCWRDMTVL